MGKCLNFSVVLFAISAIQIYYLFFGDADLQLVLFYDYSVNPKNFENKIIWITGASSGIGRELAIQLAPFQTKLILTARRNEELEELKKELIESGLKKERDILVLPADLNELNKIPDLVNQALKVYGRVDILVNNAGFSMRSLAINVSFETEQRMWNVNYHSAVMITKLLLPSMKANKYGKLVQISSIAGKFGIPLRTTYSATKAAMNAFFESLQMELYDDNIYVVNICPGFVATNITLSSIGPRGKPFKQIDPQIAAGMTVQRAVKLMLNAIENNVLETWIAKNPELILTYIQQYFIHFRYWIDKSFGPFFIKLSAEFIEKYG